MTNAAQEAALDLSGTLELTKRRKRDLTVLHQCIRDYALTKCSAPFRVHSVSTFQAQREIV
jgi:hypothetical protein